jgi:hypothetical protein
MNFIDKPNISHSKSFSLFQGKKSSRSFGQKISHVAGNDIQGWKERIPKIMALNCQKRVEQEA